MIEIDKTFRPKFKPKRFKELMENPPTAFETERGVITARKDFVRSVLSACSLLRQKLDRNNIYVGGEGSGKSHAVFQHTFIWWWCLKELGLIKYEFSMDLIYFRLKDLMDGFDLYRDVKYMIYTLDESDEITRKNWNKKIVKDLMSKLRRERKNLRVVNLLMPQLYEMLPDITLSRINWIFELDMDIDENLKVKRGDYKLFCIPVGKYVINYAKKKVTKQQVKNILADKLYNSSEKFFNLPNKILMYHGTINKTFIFDENEYLRVSREKNKESEEESGEDLNYMKIKEIKEKSKITWDEMGSMFKLTGTALKKRISSRMGSG